MSKMKITPLDMIEWEVLRSPTKMIVQESTIELPAGLNAVLVDRTDSYGLTAVLQGVVNPLEVRAWETRANALLPGDAGHRFSITAICESGAKAALNNVLLTGQRTLRGDGLMHAPLHVPEISFMAPDFIHIENEISWFTDWYLNGPEHKLLFCRSTTREVTETFKRERTLPDNMGGNEVWWLTTGAGDDDTLPGPLSSVGKDFFVVSPITGSKFLVTRAAVDNGPTWSINLGFEYRPEWGGIPSGDDRTAIGEIVGFVLGRHLLQVGTSVFSNEGLPIHEKALPAWGPDVQATCRSLDYSPINAEGRYMVGPQLEQILSQLVPKYLEVRDQFELQSALWTYWIARRMPLGTSIPLIATALETIRHAWNASALSKRNGVYMQKAEFETLLQEELNSAKSKVSEVPYGKSITNKLYASYQMSVAQQTESFFAEIGLPVDKGEAYVMWFRNQLTHSSVSTDADWELINSITHGYFSLFHRVVLKLLDYDGPYVDRSVFGWPHKPLHEPIGIRSKA
ncbi:hypothetical protein [Alicyclobacillus sp. ALC3]|uniref:hypothetical protein n=1 Tax=Alicyclobacillus sp. ALC3 TaxID=2796143 RepID=UPI00237852CD|nr:hypothetical protein [Alicyclobacillus sp. ALC3]WDL97897.1 hypothetical protein JC200_04045 [Alicyclobacillus sp. ALC3]